MKILIKPIAVLIGLLCVSFNAQATQIELNITASWTASNFNIAPTGPVSFAMGIPEENDDLVFGIAPSDGSTTFTLLVETNSAVSFASGYNGITHDWYGYSDVTLVGTHNLGSASWTTSDLVDLDGVDGLKKLLWTDSDIAVADPTRLSVRMLGDWEGYIADLFVGSRTNTTIFNNFYIGEYYAGEYINGTTIDTSTNAVNTGRIPEPATLLLMGAGLAGVVASRKKRSKNQNV